MAIHLNLNVQDILLTNKMFTPVPYLLLDIYNKTSSHLNNL